MPFSYIYLGTFKGTGRLYEPVSYSQASVVTEFAHNSFGQHDDWWIGVRSKNGRCIFDSDESPANCSMMQPDTSFLGLGDVLVRDQDLYQELYPEYNPIPSSDKCSYVSYQHINGYVEFSFYNCLDATFGLFGIICENSRDRN